MDMMILSGGVVALVLWNVLVALIFRLDKQSAIAGSWRISESSLLGLSLMGGSIGALIACKIYRHKTRKQPFASLLTVIFFLHVIGAGIVIGAVMPPLHLFGG